MWACQGQPCQTHAGHMDKYGLLERSQGSSGPRKRFLPTSHPSLKRQQTRAVGRAGAAAPGAGRAPWMGSAGESLRVDGSVGREHTPVGMGNVGWDRAVQCHQPWEKGSGAEHRSCSPWVQHWGRAVQGCMRLLRHRQRSSWKSLRKQHKVMHRGQM